MRNPATSKPRDNICHMLDTFSFRNFKNQIIAKRLSVRDAEQLVARADSGTSTKATRAKPVSRDVARLEEALSDQLGTKVSLKIMGKERGQLIIDFHGWDHCSSIIEKMHLKEDLES